MKGKTVYLGIGVVIGIVIGLVSFSKIILVNVGHIDKLTITKNNDLDKKLDDV
ncbi:hypothetical protein ACERII_14525 [Evansella sp. AB-rgal1]|uniref:hypothetical protein n=1 Tax=Evansella sp. AB-rgal1 TaxID=3242696 RepID=UPI00359EBA38